MKTDEIIVTNVSCSSCARAIKNALSEIKGISQVDVNVEQSKVKVTFDNLNRNVITSMLDSIGYPEVKEIINK